MQHSTKWEIITRTLRYVLGSRNDDLLTIGGHVLAAIEHHLVGGLTLGVMPQLDFECRA